MGSHSLGSGVSSELLTLPICARGVGSYRMNFSKDAYDVVRVWAPADIVCFSVPVGRGISDPEPLQPQLHPDPESP